MRVKGVNYARQAIVALSRGNPNHNARLTMASAAVKIGNYTGDAKALWADYAAQGCPANLREF